MEKYLYGINIKTTLTRIKIIRYTNDVASLEAIAKLEAKSIIVTCAQFASPNIINAINSVLQENKFKNVVKEVLIICTLAGEIEVHYSFERDPKNI